MPATATATRIAAPPPLSPERAHLAAAVGKHRAAVERLNLLEGAIPKASDARLAVFRAVETAEALLAAAREDQPQQYVAKLLDDTTVADGDLIASATRRLAEAKRQHDAALAGQAALEAEIGQARYSLSFARGDLTAAIAGTIAASPAAAALVAEWDAALARVESLRLAMVELNRIGLPPTGRGWDVENRLESRGIPVDPRPAAAWRAALEALTTDANAPLPGGTE
jgi:hypothetical protein